MVKSFCNLCLMYHEEGNCPQDVSGELQTIINNILDNPHPEQLHRLCHNLEKTVPLKDFCNGCENYQKKLFGKSLITKYKLVIRELIDRMKEIEELRETEDGNIYWIGNWEHLINRNEIND